ncbi:MAG: hypothetical protein SO484_03645 [Bacilli bacterium]|nr:hypothetical protein [Bacilli bacterium]
MKIRFVIAAFLIILFVPFGFVKAQNISDDISYITNQNGVRISMTDYNLLTNIYSDAYIQTMTNEDYENFKAKNININNLVKSEKYYKTEIDHLNNVVTNTEVTENEFNNYNPNIQTLSVSNFVETQYKKLSLTLSDNHNGYGDIFVGLLWKMIPSTRSFDVIAVRYVGMTDVDGTQIGRQIWGTNGNYTYVNYGWNGTNINRQDNGFGISMNITNDSTINYLENYIESAVEFTGNFQWAGASYQHATSNTTLAQSKSYTLAENGKNGVILFTGNIGEKYDNMPGVYCEL